MKRTLFLLLIAAGSICQAALPLYPENLPPRRVVTGQKTSVAVTPKSVIVIDAKASNVTRFAAKELQNILGQVLGVTLPVKHELPAAGDAIVLGLNKWSKSAGIDGEKLPRDGFVIKTAGSNLFIAGRDGDADVEKLLPRGGAWSFHFERATLFGVYDFLERFAGVRFYFPGELGTVIPRMRFIALPQLDIFERPDYLMRNYSVFYDGRYFEGPKPEAIVNPAKNLNQLRHRLQTIFLPSCHGLTKLNYIERFPDHPEYFALLQNGLRSNKKNMSFPGQLCYSSKITEEIYQDAKALLLRNADHRPSLKKSLAWKLQPHYPGYADIMPQDGFQPCQCAPCKKKYTNETHYATDLMWNLVADIANRLKKEKVPGIVTMMGYRPYGRVPAVKLPENVMIMVADGGPWFMHGKGFQNSENLIRGWGEKINKRVWLWNYCNKLSTLTMPGIPCHAPHVVGKYYSSLSHLIFGAFMQSEGKVFLYNALNYYIFSKVAWNNKFDYAKAVEEFYSLMFKAAAPEMKEFFSTIENLWSKKITGRVVETNLGPIGAPPSEDELWKEVYSPEVIAKLDSALKRAAAKVNNDPLVTKRIELFRKVYLDGIKAAAKEYSDRANLINSLHFNIGDRYENEIYLIPHINKKRKNVKEVKSVETRVAAAFMGEDLCIRFRCMEPEMKNIVAVNRKFDDTNIWQDNSVEIFLNPSGDRKHYYQILVNSLGKVADCMNTKHGRNFTHNWKWNSDAKVRISPVKGGFETEVRIPLANLGKINKKRFPVNFNRNRIVKDKKDIEVLYTWSNQLQHGFHDLQNFGTMGTDGKNLLIQGDFSLKNCPWSTRHWGIADSKRNWIEGWIGNANTRRDEKVFFSAPASMKIVSDKRGAGIAYWTLNKKLKPFKRYRLSCVVKLENIKINNRFGGVVLNLADPVNRWFPSQNLLKGSCDWQRMSFEFDGRDLPQGKNAIFNLRIMNATGTAWFDDVKIEEIN